MPRRGENIFKRKDGRWEGRYMLGKDTSGKTKYGYVYARTYKEVKQKLTLKIIEKKDSQQEKSSCDAVIFQDAAEQWLRSITPHTKESTLVKYQNLLNNHIFPELGTTAVRELCSASLEQFIQKKFTTGRLDGNGGLSRSTVQNMIVIIHSVMRYVSMDNMDLRYRSDKSLYRKKAELTASILSRENQSSLEKYLITNESPKNTGILMCLYMGLRLGEICALKWDSIFLEDGVIRIHRTMQRIQDLSGQTTKKTKIVITSPKSESSDRDIPIPKFLLSLLKKHNPKTPDCFFLTNRTDHFIEPRSYENYYHKILEINQIPRIKFHSLRHTFATRCVEAGVDAKSLSEILGHSKVNITFDRYVHVTVEMKRKNIEKIPVPEIC